jgi:hypothetical protein
MTAMTISASKQPRRVYSAIGGPTEWNVAVHQEVHAAKADVSDALMEHIHHLKIHAPLVLLRVALENTYPKLVNMVALIFNAQHVQLVIIAMMEKKLLYALLEAFVLLQVYQQSRGVQLDKIQMKYVMLLD